MLGADSFTRGVQGGYAFGRGIRERDQFSLEYRFLTREGRTVWVRDDAVFIPADDGGPDRLQGVMFDVTERRLLSEQLVQAQKVEAIGQLACCFIAWATTTATPASSPRSCAPPSVQPGSPGSSSPSVVGSRSIRATST